MQPEALLTGGYQRIHAQVPTWPEAFCKDTMIIVLLFFHLEFCSYRSLQRFRLAYLKSDAVSAIIQY